jgi:hypothetical protein
LFCQSTTRLKYIDKFDQLLFIHQWTSTVDNTVRSLRHCTIFIWYYVVKHFSSFIKSSLNKTTIAVTIVLKIHYRIEVPKTKTDYWFSKYNRVLHHYSEHCGGGGGGGMLGVWSVLDCFEDL